VGQEGGKRGGRRVRSWRPNVVRNHFTFPHSRAKLTGHTLRGIGKA